MACLSSGATAQTVVLRVDGENGGLPYWSPHNGTADGSDWGDKAFLYLQDGLDRADVLIGDPNIETVQIRVAAVEDGSGNPAHTPASMHRPHVTAR